MSRRGKRPDTHQTAARKTPPASRSSRRQSADVGDVVGAFRAGDPVSIHDASDREGETDLVYPARVVTPGTVGRLRNDAGGLVCVAVADPVARRWDLPFVQEALEHPATANHDLEYDERSSFSLAVNHRDTYTGITYDRERPSPALDERPVDAGRPGRPVAGDHHLFSTTVR